MTRGIATATKSALQAGTYRSVTFVEIDLDTPFYAWSGNFDIIIGGKLYKKAGNFLGVNSIQETKDLQSSSFVVNLSGIPVEMLSIAFGTDYRGKACRVYSACIDADHKIVGSMFLKQAGLCDTMGIDENEEGSVISMTVSGDLFNLGKPRIMRYTQDFHASTTSNTDLACQYVIDLADKQLVWGKP